ncbi:MAG: DNA-directed RNA polymerase subunit omega [Bacilli bacterium]|nr:DNA-directed RNA polymerase subunit omega [Bacilli bacterium]MDD4076799.1 DNA-directed RNA polymerase subunit omega [Bacilli bacterium]MDD4388035.1 DNA-directed RNA polymerase subunit omega [Bacilli bacterium]
MNKVKDGMRYPSIDQLIEKTKSKYRLVVGVAKRARDITSGEKVLVINPNNKKSIGIALEEVYEGKIKIVEKKAKK